MVKWPFSWLAWSEWLHGSLVSNTGRDWHTFSVFSPSGKELIKEGLWFYLLSAPGPWVCVCVSRTDFAPSETVFRHTSLAGPCLSPTFSQRHYDRGNADFYPLAKSSFTRVSPLRCTEVLGTATRAAGRSVITLPSIWRSYIKHVILRSCVSQN